MRAPEFWQTQPGLIAELLTPLGVAWDAAGRLRRAFAQPYRAGVPVVCVGNLTVGGAGKTPVVLALAKLLAEAGRSSHVVSRGYGGRLAGPVRVDPQKHGAGDVGDEALLIAADWPCWVARDRAAGARAAVAAGADVVLLDDGFQNPGIAKDLSLVVVDAEYGFGNGRLIPAGPLREAVALGLRRADAIVLVGNGNGPAELRVAGCPILRARLAPVAGERLAGSRVLGFAGIGRPEKFFATLREVGADLTGVVPFADHHPYTAEEIAGLRRDAEAADARLVTTRKDWVRLPPALRDGIEVLDVELRWADPEGLGAVLAGVLGEREKIR